MAGGMLPGRAMSLAERSRLSGIGERVGRPPGAEPATPAGQPSQGAVAAPRGRRHCWVRGPDQDRGPWPGLVLSWQRGDAGWRAWVVYLVGGPGEEAVAVQAWVDPAQLTPVSGG